MSDQPFDRKVPDTTPRGIPALAVFDVRDDAPQVPMTPNEILIVTGRSGAGRSQAAKALEDLGWYVVDNLPPAMLMTLAGMMTTHSQGVNKLAAVVDVRGREFFHSLEGTLAELQAHRIPYRIIFLEASDEELIRRFTTSRRAHPLQADGTITQALLAETALLGPLRDRADEVVDTTAMSIHDLGRRMREMVAEEGEYDTQVTLLSFGFKHGTPPDADHVLDVRFIENPYWIEELREQTGKDAPVSDYVLSRPGVLEFTESYADLILATLPGYKRELKHFVTAAIGCTGGRHRSVAVAEKLAEQLRAAGVKVHVLHRDSGRR